MDEGAGEAEGFDLVGAKVAGGDEGAAGLEVGSHGRWYEDLNDMGEGSSLEVEMREE